MYEHPVGCWCRGGDHGASRRPSQFVQVKGKTNKSYAGGSLPFEPDLPTLSLRKPIFMIVPNERANSLWKHHHWSVFKWLKKGVFPIVWRTPCFILSWWDHDFGARLETTAITMLVVMIVALSARNGKIWASIALIPAGPQQVSKCDKYYAYTVPLTSFNSTFLVLLSLKQCC